MPGQALAVPQLLTAPFRPMRPSWTGSDVSKLPFTTVGGCWHETIVKVNTEEPPANETVRVKLIVVPQTNEDEVLTRKGVVFTAVAFSAVSGYGEFGRLIVTSGVVVERTAETPEPSKQPSFRMVTLRSLHSFGSIIPLPLPPVTETALDTKANLATPLRH